MPGYLEGQSPHQQDVVVIAQHLSGESPLQGEARARADLDGDGLVTATDLWWMLRAVAGEVTLPLAPPCIHTVSPALARPGQILTLRGEAFGSSQGQATARVRLTGGEWTPTSLTWISATECSLLLPVDPDLNGITTATVRVARQGMVSNPASFEITPGPVLYSLDTVSGAASPTLVLTGRGFDNSSGTLTVHFGDQTVTPSSVSGATSLQVGVPAGVTGPTPVTVSVDGLQSNALPHTPAFDLTGQVILPSASPLDLDSLVVVAPGGILAPVAADGTFALNIAQLGLFSLEVRDPSTSPADIAQAEPVLAAMISADADAVTIDAATAALWLVLLLAGPLPVNLADAETAQLAAALATRPELSTLAGRISQHHPSEPRLLRLTQDLAPVREALEAALTVAHAEITAHLGGGGG